MFVDIFCTPQHAIQQHKPLSGAKKIYSAKLNFFVSFFKNWRTQLAAFLIWKKTRCVVLCTSKLWNVLFLACFLSLAWNYFREVARNFSKDGSKSSEMLVTMVGRRRKFGLRNGWGGKFRTFFNEISLTLTCLF